LPRTKPWARSERPPQWFPARTKNLRFLGLGRTLLLRQGLLGREIILILKEFMIPRK